MFGYTLDLVKKAQGEEGRVLGPQAKDNGILLIDLIQPHIPAVMMFSINCSPKTPGWPLPHSRISAFTYAIPLTAFQLLI